MAAPLDNWDRLSPLQREQYAGFLRMYGITNPDAADFWDRVADLALQGTHPIEAITQLAEEYPA